MERINVHRDDDWEESISVGASPDWDDRPYNLSITGNGAGASINLNDETLDKLIQACQEIKDQHNKN